MTIEEAWLFWMKTSRSTTEPPTETDFDVIKKSSHWAAFEAGWHAANSNSEVWNQAYAMGLGAGKEMGPVAWHEPGAYGNVTTHKDWALANGWEPLYKERT